MEAAVDGEIGLGIPFQPGRMDGDGSRDGLLVDARGNVFSVDGNRFDERSVYRVNPHLHGDGAGTVPIEFETPTDASGECAAIRFSPGNWNWVPGSTRMDGTRMGADDWRIRADETNRRRVLASLPGCPDSLFGSGGVVASLLDHRLMASMPPASGFREGLWIASVNWIGKSVAPVF